MKIGILTFHCAHNFGAVLQAYATQEQLKKMGHEVEIIDYQPAYLRTRYKLFINKEGGLLVKLKCLLANLFKCRVRHQRIVGFERFIKDRMVLSPKKYTAPFQYNKEYDLYVIGSDQVWNPEITEGFDTVFWGNFGVKDGARIISYAASMAAIELTESSRAFIKESLTHFSSIAVRETALAQFLQQFTPKEINIVQDPTLLVDISVWKKIATKPNLSDPYLLVYPLGNYKDVIRMSRAIAKEKKLQMVVLSPNKKDRRENERYIIATPEEFVGWFMYADFIVTSSFHGTAFSLIFTKSFYTILKGNSRDERQKTLLKSVGLEDRAVYPNQSPKFSITDYSVVLDRLIQLREKSISYLEKSI